MKQTKPFEISKMIVLKAFQKVKANKGSVGIDGESLKEFEAHLKDNLYKIWNRMSSGTYFPPPVKRVEIPKGNGKIRPLGIPTVGDRVAQMVVKMYLEPEIEPYFHNDSYGYRPGRSAHHAVQTAMQRCGDFPWVIDLDIKGFFDNIDHRLMMKAVRKHTDCKWILLYVERWLKAPIEYPDGKIIKPEKGTPQGGVISPLIANLFLHYSFDKWMEEYHGKIPFERYADDVIVHCVTEKQAEFMKREIGKRLNRCKLELHPEKTKVVYCKSVIYKEKHSNIAFDFLGFTFRPRKCRNRKGKIYLGFTPAISSKSRKKISETIRNWKLNYRVSFKIGQIADNINPVIQGWINYYGKFRKSALFGVYKQLFFHQVKWAKEKYKMRSFRKSEQWLKKVAQREPKLFVYWQHWYRVNGGITRAV